MITLHCFRLPLFGDVYWILDFVADGRVEGVVGASEGTTTTSYRGTGNVIGRRSRTVVQETRVVRILVCGGFSVYVWEVCVGVLANTSVSNSMGTQLLKGWVRLHWQARG